MGGACGQWKEGKDVRAAAPERGEYGEGPEGGCWLLASVRARERERESKRVRERERER